MAENPQFAMVNKEMPSVVCWWWWTDGTGRFGVHGCVLHQSIFSPWSGLPSPACKHLLLHISISVSIYSSQPWWVHFLPQSTLWLSVSSPTSPCALYPALYLSSSPSLFLCPSISLLLIPIQSPAHVNLIHLSCTADCSETRCMLQQRGKWVLHRWKWGIELKGGSGATTQSDWQERQLPRKSRCCVKFTQWAFQLAQIVGMIVNQGWCVL